MCVLDDIEAFRPTCRNHGPLTKGQHTNAKALGLKDMDHDRLTRFLSIRATRGKPARPNYHFVLLVLSRQ